MLKTKNVLNKQLKLSSNIWILEIVWERVPDNQTSHGKSPVDIHAQMVTRYDQKMSTGGTKVQLT